MTVLLLKKFIRFFILAAAVLMTDRSMAQSCPAGSTKISRDGGTITVRVGQSFCIMAGVTYNGAILMQGGTLTNFGNVRQLVISDGGGTINNYLQITCNDIAGSIASKNLNITCFGGAEFDFLTPAEFDTDEETNISFSVYTGGTMYFDDDLAMPAGDLTITNGIFSEDYPDDDGVFTVAGGMSLNGANLSLANNSGGSFNVSNDFDINGGSTQAITNHGSWNVTSDFYCTGMTSLTINNNGFMYVDDNAIFDSDMETFSFSNTSDGDYSSPGFTSWVFSCAVPNAVISADAGSSFWVSTDLTLTHGSISLAGATSGVEGTLSNSGTFSNSSSNLFTSDIQNSGTFNNTGNIQVLNALTNSGTFNVSGSSEVLMTTLTNNLGATFTGPADDPRSAANTPKLVIDGTSSNSGTLGGYINIHDLSLTAGDGTTHGIDVGSGGPHIIFASYYDGLTHDTKSNCDWIENGSVSAHGSTKPDVFLCAYGGGTVQLFANLNVIPYTNVPHPVVSQVYYTWQPGNITQQNPVIPTPSVTTIYTVTANYGGCFFTQTVQISVDGTAFPSISYTSTPAFLTSDPTQTYNVTQTGGSFSGWTYHIAPTNSLITINAATGSITAHGNCFGLYVVSLCPPPAPTPPPSTVCGYACVTTTINLVNLACPFEAPPTLSLCPGDKKQLIVYGGVPSTYVWQPADPALSCTACITPTITFSGSVTMLYTVTAYRDGRVCGSTVYTIVPKRTCQPDDIIGCCFSNYGAAVWINGPTTTNTTYLNVYCNLVDELSYRPGSPATLSHGVFESTKNGSARVLLDWIHNGQNTLYIYSGAVPQGTTSLFGADQKVRGNSSTVFDELWLQGSGTKSIWINEFGYSNLDLTSNILDMQGFVFAMKTPTTVVRRTSGYSSNNLTGYFSKKMDAGQITNADHLFPLGSKATATQAFRYRPLVMHNNSGIHGDEISAGLMNAAPSLTDGAFVNAPTATVVTAQAPNVLQINHAYYHHIKNTPASVSPVVAPLTPPVPVSSVTVKSYYVSSDGQFQSLAEWEKDPAQAARWWGSTPGASASLVPSTDPGTSGMIFAQASGTLSFSHEPFALSRGGFYVNTNSFGNNSPTNNTQIVITSSGGGGGGGSTPSGGGLSSSFGTGSSSGNTGGGGPTIFSPNPVAGDYVMTINSSNSCMVGGQIKFNIDMNGNITPTLVTYGTGTSQLSPDVYTIDNINSGITFSATPRALIHSCVNDIVVTTTNNDYILTSGENILVTAPSPTVAGAITYGTFNLFNASSAMIVSAALTAGSTTSIIPPTLAVGLYNFEIQVNATATPFITETLKGQIIVK